MQTYTCSYPYAGSRWVFHIPAASREEAEARLRALAWAKVDGEVAVTIPVPDASGLLRWWRRMWA